ncbi:hypothetical protein LAZ67_1007151 [Cordylochernes scorpioides]|uniref:Uncharacterized protein n=1 Tax=Cordylochernes scorpioides TaxID=51811 RepID=A0ABY6K2R1_9ARAC|nr:hypothetical protein LAZ67_1007151 [Cordylochernes scorpioides]
MTLIKLEALAGNTQTLFGAGSDTARTTLSWIVLTMALKPHYQTKLRIEARNVLGPNKTPRPEDRTSMPFTEAFVLEILRWQTIAPLSLPRRTSTTVQMAGYTLPEGTMVIPNLYACHHDRKYWGDPETFRPERFLNENGTKLVKHEAFMPFTLGRRSCPGEGLAISELFLYTAAIANRFQVALVPGTSPTFEGITHLVYEPVHINFCFIPLNSPDN